MRFHPGDVFAGQERHVWVTLRAPTASEASIGLGRFDLSYQAGGELREIGFERRPTVTCVREEEDFFAAVDIGIRERSIRYEELGFLKQQVSDAVRAGDRAAAVRHVSTFRDAKKRENATLRSQEVDRVLDELDALDASVSQAFEASPDDAAGRQNSLGKELYSEGWKLRALGYAK